MSVNLFYTTTLLFLKLKVNYHIVTCCGTCLDKQSEILQKKKIINEIT